jgi:hypothetical protein
VALSGPGFNVGDLAHHADDAGLKIYLTANSVEDLTVRIYSDLEAHDWWEFDTYLVGGSGTTDTEEV